MKELLCYTAGAILVLYTSPIWMGAIAWLVWNIIWFWASNFLQVTFGSVIIVIALILYNRHK